MGLDHNVSFFRPVGAVFRLGGGGNSHKRAKSLW